VDGPLRDLRRGGDNGGPARGFGRLADRDRGTAAGEAMTRADEKVEHAADRLQLLADRAAAEDGLRRRLARPLADDADFLRKLKPSLIKARAKGELPTGAPGSGRVAPSGPQLGTRPRPARTGGPSPFLVLGISFATGVAVAKWIDWRGHAHPKR
jgi:hypothetical protein